MSDDDLKMTICISHLRKPRPLEQRLLSLFLEFYDTYIYNTFLNIRNRQIIAEDDLHEERLELSRVLIAVWDILNRVIENYEAYVMAMKDVKRRYIGPAMESLANSPEICRSYQGIITQPGQESHTDPQPVVDSPPTGAAPAAMKKPKEPPKGFI
jgi:hypothetical protein